MHITPAMLDAAFRFRRAEPWKLFPDKFVYAVALPSGKTGYCSVMGHGAEDNPEGMYTGLSLFTGDENFSTYLRAAHAPENANERDAGILSLSSDSIICSFSQAASMMFEESKDPVRKFAKENSRPIPRKAGWPEFIRHLPYRALHPVEKESDALDITEALDAGHYFTRYFGDKVKVAKDLDYPELQGGRKVPLLTRTENGFDLTETVLPAAVPFTWPEPEIEDKRLLISIRAMQKNGALECGVLPVNTSLEHTENTPFAFPVVLADTRAGTFFLATCKEIYGEKPEALLYDIAQQIRSSSEAPAEITAADELTAGLLKKFCKKTGIKLTKKRKPSKGLTAAMHFVIREMQGLPGIEEPSAEKIEKKEEEGKKADKA